ncbi:unnamed protein product [uncultured bacterium]|nr:unnamed protein product [uncultured bacterium]
MQPRFNAALLKSPSGSAFAPLNNGPRVIEVSAIAIDPQRPSNVYAGTKGRELFRSFDGGQTWSLIFAGPSINDIEVPVELHRRDVRRDRRDAVQIWLRLQALDNSKFNDVVWVRFSDALTSGGQPIYPIDSTSGLLVNLATDSAASSLRDGAGGRRRTGFRSSRPSPSRRAARTRCGSRRGRTACSSIRSC